MCLRLEAQIIPPFLPNAAALITTRAATRAGFIEVVIEKNRRATPHLDDARALRSLVLEKCEKPRELLALDEGEKTLVVAAGVSEKASRHLDAEDKREAVRVSVSEFLEPQGANWIDELVYRFLLARGDALGGEMRNAIGALGQRKLARALMAQLRLSELEFHWQHAKLKQWSIGKVSDAGIENELNGLFWRNKNETRTLLFNLTPPGFSKNIDLCLAALDPTNFKSAKELRAALKQPEIYLAFGELKSGFDPAGADEHWKTARSAFERIRQNYAALNPATFFVGAAIVPNMADEIWTQLQDATLSSAANLTDEMQLAGLCRWLVHL